MQIYMFASGRDPTAFAFTNARTDALLPTALAPWRPLGNRPVSCGGEIGGARLAAVAAGREHFLVVHARLPMAAPACC